ncbi:hypothetical protein GGQ74_001315 [Desulfobaculum xiamenense]|uniref:Type I restriction enzyme R protein N-terminal domain-containing protein n=1 Tax=Desulfobaculum xiamenense TaxID=995050 RepID=A0A846QQK4_9BACT|nr:type I restriction enzyme HsdR N-terminal domain-containing protein [Desulfobaculum xiamenense]NJB67675.1 hypothetical protein [Desulfobaculum xiamenense]
MHETSLGRVVRDYLSGENVEETSYEEFRQAMARMLVEELGYPRERLGAKVGIEFSVDGTPYCRVVDIVVHDEADRPLMLVFFVPGQPGSYEREVVAAARLYPGGAVPLAVVTDTREALLIESHGGTVIETGVRAIARYDALPALVREHPARELDEAHLERERRILYAYSEFIYGSCCHTCTPKPTPPRGGDGDAT